MIWRTVYDSGASERSLDTYSQLDRSMDRMQLGANVALDIGGEEWNLEFLTRAACLMRREPTLRTPSQCKWS